MKAIDVLKWINFDGISGETTLVYDLDETTDYKSLFGYEPVVRPVTGTYLVVYSDCIDRDYLPRVERLTECDGVYRKQWVPVAPDCTILTDNEVEDAMGQYELQKIYLYKLED